MPKCLACDDDMSAERAREGRLCETCEAGLGTPEEAAKSFAWASAEAAKAGSGKQSTQPGG